MLITIPLKLIPINGQGFHLMLEASLQGYKMNLILDTGATLSVFDLERTRRISGEEGIKPRVKFFSGIGGENLQTFSKLFDAFSMGNLILSNREIILLDMKKINLLYASFNLPRVDGVLGGDILTEYNASIDYARLELIFRTEAPAE